MKLQKWMGLQFANMRLRLFVVTALIPLVSMRKLQELVLIAMSLGNRNNQCLSGLLQYQQALKQWGSNDWCFCDMDES